jgi:hypothetical protein
MRTLEELAVGIGDRDSQYVGVVLAIVAGDKLQNGILRDARRRLSEYGRQRKQCHGGRPDDRTKFCVNEP